MKNEEEALVTGEKAPLSVCSSAFFVGILGIVGIVFFFESGCGDPEGFNPFIETFRLNVSMLLLRFFSLLTHKNKSNVHLDVQTLKKPKKRYLSDLIGYF